VSASNGSSNDNPIRSLLPHNGHFWLFENSGWGSNRFSGTAVEDKSSGLGLPADLALLQHRPAEMTYIVPHGAHQDGGGGDFVFWHSGYYSRVMTLWKLLLVDTTLQQTILAGRLRRLYQGVENCKFTVNCDSVALMKE